MMATGTERSGADEGGEGNSAGGRKRESKLAVTNDHAVLWVAGRGIECQRGRSRGAEIAVALLGDERAHCGSQGTINSGQGLNGNVGSQDSAVVIPQGLCQR